MIKNSFLIFLLMSSVWASAQSPGGVSSGLRTWYKANAFTGLTNGTDVASWPDQYNGDGAYQNAVQNGKNISPYISNRQPQYRTPVAQYNYNPYLDFSKTFSSLFSYQALSATPDYRYNYTTGTTLYQVGALTSTQGWFLGTGLGATTAPIAGTNYEYGYPWWGLNQQFYGVACGYYYATVDDYYWYTFPYPPYSYNYSRPQRKTVSGQPYISSVSYDKYATNNSGAVVGTDAKTAMQTRVNGDKWSWAYNYTPAGPSLFIGNELTNYNAGRWWKGGIPEVILYNRKLNTAKGDEADKVDSYLGIKYGITLQHSYYLSTGTLAWDTGCNNTYNNDIIGLVRDNGSALYQKQSHSVNKKTAVTISLGALNENDNSANSSTITDTYSLMLGSNGIGGSSRDNRSIPGGYAALVSQVPPVCLTSTNVVWTRRKWRVAEQTGKDLGSVNLYIESKEISAVDWTCQAYIVVGSDSAFSNPVYYPLSLATATTGSSTDYLATINFCEGASNASTGCGALKTQYFAIVGKGGKYYPGGVSAGLQFWVRADDGTINDSALSKQTDAVPGVVSRVRTWVNQTGGPNAVPGIAGDAPTLRAPSRYDNFNPMVSFQNLGLNLAVGGENYDPDYATMVAPGVLSTASSTVGADSLSMFASHRNLADWYNAPIGMGNGGLYPGLMLDLDGHNSVEYIDGVNGNLSQTTIKTFSSPYPVTNTVPYGASNYTVSSSFGRTYQSALFWYPQFPLTMTSATLNTVTYALRGNGQNLPMTTQSRTTAMSAYNTVYNRGDVAIGGGSIDYGCLGMHDAILYNRGFRAASFEMERVETYLGIKSGITMLHNYYATDQTLIWDTTAYVDAAPNVTGYTRYNKSITGIGRDDVEALQQRVSRNAEDTTITMSIGLIPASEDQTDVTTDFSNDKEYIIWGGNGASQGSKINTDLPSSLPGCLEYRLPREYHVHLTGTNSGTYATQLRWQLDANILDTISSASISLLIDDDGDGNFATGTVRTIPCTSYDRTTNTAIFDGINWATTGDAAPNDAAITIAWNQSNLPTVLYNGAAGGGGCSCAAATAYTATALCTDANNWTSYKNKTTNNKAFAINWGTNAVTATVTLDASATAAARRKTSLNVSVSGVMYDSAATIGARMANITLTSGTITSPVKVRFYLDSAEFKTDSTWIIGTSGVGNGGGTSKVILQDSAWKWFKFEGTIANVLSNLSASGLPVGDGATANTAMPIIPDERGVEDGVNYVQFNYLTSFSTIGYVQTFVKSNNLVLLPIGLKSFTVQNNACDATLKWTTATESNSDKFEVESSADMGGSWKKVGTVAAAGNSSIEKNYQYSTSLQPGVVNLFRLKMIDKNGVFNYSSIQSIRCDGKPITVSLFPNPSKNVVYITGLETGSSVKIFTNDGKILVNNKAVTNTMSQNISQWSSGNYFVQVTNGTSTTTLKLLKQ